MSPPPKKKIDTADENHYIIQKGDVPVSTELGSPVLQMRVKVLRTDKNYNCQP